MCKPFADPKIGGVGTRQSVYGSKGFLARMTDMFLDHRYFDENASQSFLGRAVSCLSGRTAVYRRKLLHGDRARLHARDVLGRAVPVR